MVHSKQSTSKDFMFWAAKRGYSQIVVRCIQSRKAKSNPNVTESALGNTLLHSAAREGHLNEVKILLGEGLNIHAIQCDGTTALYLAAEEGHLDIVKYLAEKGAIIEAPKQDKTTPLWIASKNAHLDTVIFLRSKGAQIEVFDFKNQSPIDTAINQIKLLISSKRDARKHCEVVKFLLNEGGSYNDNDMVVKILDDKDETLYPEKTTLIYDKQRNSPLGIPKKYNSNGPPRNSCILC